MANSFIKIFFFLLSLFVSVIFAARLEAQNINFLVPKETINYQQIINNNMLRYKVFSINAQAAQRYVLSPSQIEGKAARRILLKNQPILLSELKNPILVEQGKQVKMVVKTGYLCITAMGVPLQSGAVGDYIKVRNMDSGRVVSGTILSDGTVSISGE